MKTLILDSRKAKDIERAATLLKAGELVALPTETVYGLAADASNPEAVAKIFAAKQRPTDHPLITHIGDLAKLKNWVKQVPDWVYPLAEKFWPGPLTLIFERGEHVSDVITGGLPTIGIRIPDHPLLLSLLKQYNLAVAAPSANPYQKLSPTTAEHVLAGLDGKIAAVVDGGPCQVGTESTILRISEHRAEILRSGPLAAADLQPFVKVPISTPLAHQQAVSGNKKIHYQPNAKVVICSSDEITHRVAQSDTNTAVLLYGQGVSDEGRDKLSCRVVKNMPVDHHGYRKALYAALYELDIIGVQEILIETPPKEESWNDIWDRLSRAAAS
ncbi:L-threonylcarbamoyladenylate synthase [Thalassotalea ponticola]|uniref:L-threonylcarbamoyladenylate synthase n=1 Tax=Thalassotalea ponticola TaxID=1523392 RepID=UPI0025B2B663|nr:L-threonylcarbamoyladenylate synthase [Thalassotalea ponticola]MDN3652367.1 L-threonylcarbamoyladenylate synthase [Thalassotalea ponticola]